jgi:hypothetical protein
VDDQVSAVFERQPRGRCAVGVLAVAVLVLAGCTSGSGHGRTTSSPSRSAPATTGHSDFCARLAAAAERIAGAETDLYASRRPAARALQSQLQPLQAEVPPNVGAALAELALAFRTAQRLLEHPTARNKAKLAELQPKLSLDTRIVTQYVVGKCPGH